MAFQAGATGIIVMNRALETLTTTSSSSASSDTPFFPTSLVPPTPTSDSSNKQTLSKSILEWLFFVIALVLISTFLMCRSWQLRRRNRPFNQFFSISRNTPSGVGRPSQLPRTTGLPSLNEPHRPISLTRSMLYPDLSPMPAAFRSNGRRTRAADTDAGGRRAGGPEDGSTDFKDMLPAYDNIGGPPKYVEMAMDARIPLHLDLAGAVESRDTPDLERGTPMQSAEEDEGGSSSHSGVEPSHRRPEPEDSPNPDRPDAHLPS